MNKKLIISMLFTLLFSASAGVSYAQKKASSKSSNKNDLKEGGYVGNLERPTQKGYNGIPVYGFITRNYFYVEGQFGYQDFVSVYTVNTYTGGIGTCLYMVGSDLTKLSYSKKDDIIYVWEDKKPEKEEDYFDILKIEKDYLFSYKTNAPYYFTIDKNKTNISEAQIQAMELQAFYKLLQPSSFPKKSEAQIAEEERQKRIQDSIDAENKRIQDSIREVQRRIEQQRIDSINRAKKLLEEYAPYKSLFKTNSEFENCILGDSRLNKLHSIINDKMDEISIHTVKGKELLKSDHKYYASELETLCQLYDRTSDSYIDHKLKCFVLSRKKLDKLYNRKAKHNSYSYFLQNYMNGKYTSTGKVIRSILGITAGTAAIVGTVFLLKSLKK